MYILKSVNANMNKAYILDTDSQQMNEVALSAVAMQVNRGTIKVYGLRTLRNADANCQNIVAYNISVCTTDAQLALIEWFTSMGMSRADAEKKVGYKRG